MYLLLCYRQRRSKRGRLDLQSHAASYHYQRAQVPIKAVVMGMATFDRSARCGATKTLPLASMFSETRLAANSKVRVCDNLGLHGYHKRCKLKLVIVSNQFELVLFLGMS